jgi:hypothetical protein
MSIINVKSNLPSLYSEASRVVVHEDQFAYVGVGTGVSVGSGVLLGTGVSDGTGVFEGTGV